jgi:hypothetical protein
LEFERNLTDYPLSDLESLLHGLETLGANPYLMLSGIHGTLDPDDLRGELLVVQRQRRRRACGRDEDHETRYSGRQRVELGSGVQHCVLKRLRGLWR